MIGPKWDMVGWYVSKDGTSDFFALDKTKKSPNIAKLFQKILKK
jgi:hypothetical protein